MHKKNLHLQGLDQAGPLQAVADPHGPCRGDANLGAEPAVTLMITARESTGRTLSSKLVVRGPIFMAMADNPIKANTGRTTQVISATIWTFLSLS